VEQIHNKATATICSSRGHNKSYRLSSPWLSVFNISSITFTTEVCFYAAVLLFAFRRFIVCNRFCRAKAFGTKPPRDYSKILYQIASNTFGAPLGELDNAFFTANAIGMALYNT